MQMIPVDSETVRSVGYDARSRVLPVAFGSGGTYEYVGVPLHLYEAMLMHRTRGGASADWSEPTATAASRTEQMSAWAWHGPPWAPSDRATRRRQHAGA